MSIELPFFLIFPPEMFQVPRMRRRSEWTMQCEASFNQAVTMVCWYTHSSWFLVSSAAVLQTVLLKHKRLHTNTVLDILRSFEWWECVVSPGLCIFGVKKAFPMEVTAIDTLCTVLGKMQHLDSFCPFSWFLQGSYVLNTLNVYLETVLCYVYIQPLII